LCIAYKLDPVHNNELNREKKWKEQRQWRIGIKERYMLEVTF